MASIAETLNNTIKEGHGTVDTFTSGWRQATSSALKTSNTDAKSTTWQQGDAEAYTQAASQVDAATRASEDAQSIQDTITAGQQVNLASLASAYVASRGASMTGPDQSGIYNDMKNWVASQSNPALQTTFDQRVGFLMAGGLSQSAAGTIAGVEAMRGAVMQGDTNAASRMRSIMGSAGLAMGNVGSVERGNAQNQYETRNAQGVPTTTYKTNLSPEVSGKVNGPVSQPSMPRGAPKEAGSEGQVARAGASTVTNAPSAQDAFKNANTGQPPKLKEGATDKAIDAANQNAGKTTGAVADMAAQPFKDAVNELSNKSKDLLGKN